ncbi:hypothetical protein LTR36_004947 [Oleoguttula mirabilis]|uniref:SnoaL-like domain-containing protein n=1 Tax=Oleoguttula mirabilis TaxID=1507867 RepID=A0AAV9JVL3_9PEZI|nr:hypothetical protein LTR36_004947 [Oleoguttula mirabilis]
MEEAEWPSQPVPEAIKELIARFYSLVDSSDPSCCEGLANTVFTQDGEFLVNKRSMKGAEQIAKWRTGGESVILRQHTIHKIYVCNEQGNDLLMTGTLTLGSDLGLTAESPYCARCVVDDPTSQSPRIEYWQGWLDTTPFYDLGILRNPARKNTGNILDTIGGR